MHAITIIAIVAAASAAAVIAAIAWSYNPQTTSSPTQFGDSTPQIRMVYAGNMYEGQLLGSVFGAEAIPELPNLDQTNITSVSSPGVTLQQDTVIGFTITGGSSQPESISVTAHSASGGADVTTVQQDAISNSFRIDIPPGEYVLVATATWVADPAEQASNGYVVYGYRVIVV